MRNFLLPVFLLLAILGANADNGKRTTPLMGWSSWNTYGVHINDSIICSQADALIRRGLKDAGYNYVNVDDGFFGYRDRNGFLLPHPERFPEGLRGLVDYIHHRGLKAGIYTDAGSNTCGSIWQGDTCGVGTAIYGHEKQDAELFFNFWNFDFIKVDYCGALDLGLDEQRRYTEIYNEIKKVAKRDVEINICRWAFPGCWAKDVADSWRISEDIYAEWKSIKLIIGKNMYLSAYASPGKFNDMDMLELGMGLSDNEEEVHFGMWCIMSSPLLIGCDINSINDKTLALLKNKELIAVNQDPTGEQAHVVNYDNGTYTLVRDIKYKGGNNRVVALYNPTDSVRDMNFTSELLGFKGKLSLRDLINKKNVSEQKDSFAYTLQPRSIKIFKVKGRHRIEEKRYEAEWAYMPCFNDLGHDKTPLYLEDENASCGAVIKNVGGTPENYASWQVFSKEGGYYKLRIHYRPLKHSHLYVSTELDKLIEAELENTNSDDFYVTEVPVTLHRGYNEIIMGSKYTWMPEIDYFELIKR